MRIGIVGGTGKMGRWFEGFFKKQGFEVLVWDETTEIDPEEVVPTLDVLIVSVPLSVLEGVIKQLGPYLRKDALFIDISSVKVLPVKWMLEASRSEVIGAHPLFGPRDGLWEDLSICLCPARGKRWLEEVRLMFEKGGLKVILATPEEHDKAMALVQVIHHLSNLALGSMVTKWNPQGVLSFFTVGFRKRMELLRGILGDDPDMYRQMVLMNPWAKEALEGFLEEFKWVVGLIEDKKWFEGLFLRLRDTLFPKGQTRLAYLGPEGTFSHLAALKVKAEDWELLPLSSLKEVFGAVERGDADYGIVPVENSLEGMVNETHDLFFETSLKVLAEVPLKISYVLASPLGDSHKVKRIYSHWQALAQCREWLETNYPQAELIQTESTAKAALLALKDEEGAAVLAPQAARLYGLKVLFESIEATGDNVTRFFLIGKRPLGGGLRPSKASLCFLLPHVPGALHRALEPFAREGINLTRIVSRPLKGSRWEYVFFVDLEIPTERRKLERALEALKERAALVKFLGEYELWT